jgi:hypothetical protein
MYQLYLRRIRTALICTHSRILSPYSVVKELTVELCQRCDSAEAKPDDGRIMLYENDFGNPTIL